MSTSPKIAVIIPQQAQKDADILKSWLLQQPETSLLAQLEIYTPEWSDLLIGEAQDWLNIARLLEQLPPEVRGIVIWAPEQSVLQLMGLLSMIYPNPGKPLIGFVTPAANVLAKKTSALLSLKATMIHALYLAASDMAEALILHEGQVFRPRDCFWHSGKQGRFLTAAAEPAALIDYSLRPHGGYQTRHNLPLKNVLGFQLDQGIQSVHWQPGLPAHQSWPPADARGIFVRVPAALWNQPSLQRWRRILLDRSLPTIWYSQSPWQKNEPEAQERFISHAQPWWAYLAAQVSFGATNENQEALRLLPSLIEQRL